ncbi:MAG: tRNA preQ1(34) S-adenosylmethionine ribosyltransferase-isomerase QueA [Bacilli bacterium]|jgi:S-adenosylmethionine:tRNA ribosyltransferase-isomerase
MDIELFNFNLPEELIAQSPCKKRDNSRLLIVNRCSKQIEDKHFYDIADYLSAGDVLVRNNTKVIPARLIGVKEKTNARIELLLLRNLGDDVWECLVGNAKAIHEGSQIDFGEKKLIGECVEVLDEGIRHIHFLYRGIFMEILDQLGKMPLPPYIKHQCDDNSQYQTIYAKVEGSAAAPTAGFHFTDELFDKLLAKGVEIIDVTLHIGLGTFRPIKTSNVEDHHMHSEYYEISKRAAERLNLAKHEGRRIIAIGTTSARTLEANMNRYKRFTSTKEETDIFIVPGYKFLAIDALITNFHLPKSTLIMLVSAFMGREFTLQVYQTAINNKYRFFSFGDAMFIYGQEK